MSNCKLGQGLKYIPLHGGTNTNTKYKYEYKIQIQIQIQNTNTNTKGLKDIIQW